MIPILCQLWACIYITDPVHRDKPITPDDPATQPVVTPVPAVYIHAVEYGLDTLWLDVEVLDADTGFDDLQLTVSFEGTVLDLSGADVERVEGATGGWLRVDRPTDCGFDFDIEVRATDPDEQWGEASASATVPALAMASELGTPPFAACGALDGETAILWEGATPASVFHLQDTNCQAWVEGQGTLQTWDFGATPDPRVYLTSLDGQPCRIAVLDR